MVQNSELPLQGAGFQSLVVEIRSHRQSTGVAKRIKKKKKKAVIYSSIHLLINSCELVKKERKHLEIIQFLSESDIPRKWGLLHQEPPQVE